MGLLANVKEKEIQAWVHIRNKFEVLCRYLPQKELNDLVRKSTTKKRQRDGSWDSELDEVKWAKRFVQCAVLDWKGLTIETLSQIMPLDNDAREALTEKSGGSGEIPYSEEDALELCQRIPWRHFAGYLNAFSTDVEVALEADKAKNASASKTSVST